MSNKQIVIYTISIMALVTILRFRRRELVAIDLVWEPEGVIIRLPCSKSDQNSSDSLSTLPFGAADMCPSAAIKIWIDVGDKSLNPGAINDLLKGLEPHANFDFVPKLSSYSFRHGLSDVDRPGESRFRPNQKTRWMEKRRDCMGVYRGRANS